MFCVQKERRGRDEDRQQERLEEKVKKQISKSVFFSAKRLNNKQYRKILNETICYLPRLEQKADGKQDNKKELENMTRKQT